MDTAAEGKISHNQPNTGSMEDHMPMTKQELDRRFSMTRGDETTAPKIAAILATCRETAEQLSKATPEGREQALAITKLEEAANWACLAVTRNAGQHETNVTVAASQPHRSAEIGDPSLLQGSEFVTGGEGAPVTTPRDLG